MKSFSLRQWVSLVLVLIGLLTSNCQRVTLPPLPIEPFRPHLVRLSPDEYPFFFDNGDKEELIRALKKQINYFYQLTQPALYSFGRKTISSETIKETLEQFLRILEHSEGQDLNQLIKTYFEVYQSNGENGTGMVTFTGYYLPQVEGNLTPRKEYRYPLYRLPDDLVIRATKPHGLKKAVRIKDGKEYPYYTRKQIDEEGVLKGKGYEIVYLKNLIDCYLLHVQGSGVVRLSDGTLLPLHFAGSNYYPYRSLREEMLKDGVISPEQASMESIRSYFAQHPDQLQHYLNRNERYTFFSLWKGDITGSLGIPLTPGRSIATDKQIFPPGALSYMVTGVPSITSSDLSNPTKSWSRFVLAQDEGGAIRGPHRVDLFCGAGVQAEYLASHLRHSGKLYFLIAKDTLESP